MKTSVSAVFSVETDKLKCLILTIVMILYNVILCFLFFFFFLFFFSFSFFFFFFESRKFKIHLNSKMFQQDATFFFKTWRMSQSTTQHARNVEATSHQCRCKVTTLMRRCINVVCALSIYGLLRFFAGVQAFIQILCSSHLQMYYL